MEIANGARWVLECLENAGHEAYLVGGCVRDWVMGRQCADFDIASSALPEQTRALFESMGAQVLLTGEKHGTVTVLAGGPVEVTAFREDGDYADGRHPASVTFTKSIIADLSRRDFTVNAMAYNPHSGLIDPFGGREDAARGILRTVGRPQRRFEEDALRILRGVRFCSVLGLTAQEETAEAMIRSAERLGAVSQERKYAELIKLLKGKNVLTALTEYERVISAVIPELAPCVGFEQHSRHHDFDVYGHICRTVAGVPEETHLRLAALFHDIEKPSCYIKDERGGHFPGHQGKSAQTAGVVLARLRAPKETQVRVVLLVKLHDLPLPEGRGGILRLISRTGAEAFFELMQLKEADERAKRADGKDTERTEAIERTRELAARLIREGACTDRAHLAVRGEDIMSLGIRGAGIGRALEKAFYAVTDGLPNEKRAIMDFLKGEQRGCAPEGAAIKKEGTVQIKEEKDSLSV